jgi:hypothetical protein
MNVSKYSDILAPTAYIASFFAKRNSTLGKTALHPSSGKITKTNSIGSNTWN